MPGVPVNGASRTLLLAPGASGGASSMDVYVSRLAARDVRARIVELGTRDAERAVPAYRRALESVAGGAAVVGGHSFGGRVASLLAAQQPVPGLVLMCYPLHAPGRHATWRARTAHWPDIRCPVLLLSGEADPFARTDLLREALRQLPRAELVTYPGVRHGLGPVLEDAVARIAAFVRELPVERPMA